MQLGVKCAVPEVGVILNFSITDLEEAVLPTTEDLLGDDRIQDCIDILGKILQQQRAPLLNALQHLPVYFQDEWLRFVKGNQKDRTVGPCSFDDSSKAIPDDLACRLSSFLTNSRLSWPHACSYQKACLINVFGLGLLQDA